MNSNDSAPPKANARPRRFQFSLRALMLAVLAFGALWIATHEFGRAAVVEHYASIWKSDRVEALHESNRIGVTATEGNYQETRRGKVMAPAPFVLLFSWEPSSGPIEGTSPSENGIYLWFFGWTVTVRDANYPRFNRPVYGSF